jgi:hypothetical protein
VNFSSHPLESPEIGLNKDDSRTVRIRNRGEPDLLGTRIAHRVLITIGTEVVCRQFNSLSRNHRLMRHIVVEIMPSGAKS